MERPGRCGGMALHPEVPFHGERDPCRHGRRTDCSRERQVSSFLRRSISTAMETRDLLWYGADITRPRGAFRQGRGHVVELCGGAGRAGAGPEAIGRWRRAARGTSRPGLAELPVDRWSATSIVTGRRTCSRQLCSRNRRRRVRGGERYRAVAANRSRNVFWWQSRAGRGCESGSHARREIR